MSFTNKVVLITGAATGLGAAIALGFAKLNATLCITDISEANLLKTKTECEGLSKETVLEVIADLRKDEDVARIVDSVLKAFGKIDVLVNCAGIVKAARLQDSDIIAKFDEIISVNLRAAIVMTRYALPALIASKGCIINISSVASRLITRNILPYNISKAGLLNFTKCAAFELAPHGVRVNCISPGAVKTNLWINAGATEEEHHTIWDTVIEQTPLKKSIEGEEVAELTIYLASDKAASITGSDFVIDAGLLLGTVGTVGVPESIVKNVS
ncbi:3-oxoacyl-[acyl-carrier-protein] reductase FabG-like [Epargyreus clarus]|uniref:3-oxoacyl-[acyl-carrier-protein] reductase FabG-like n=1 Tax=Epargyreus clarus TaxID=520877 RepID=UPI003C2FF68C